MQLREYRTVPENNPICCARAGTTREALEYLQYLQIALLLRSYSPVTKYFLIRLPSVTVEGKR